MAGARAPRKPTKKAAKVGSRRPAKPPAREAGARAPAANPSPISTGKGPSPLEICRDLIALFNAGKWREIEDKYWSPDIVSVEGYGVSMAWSGRAAVEAKNAQWSAQHTILGASAEGPYVGAAGFAVKFRMEVRENATGATVQAEEIGVYTVKDGKIVREEFMYGPRTLLPAEATGLAAS